MPGAWRARQARVYLRTAARFCRRVCRGGARRRGGGRRERTHQRRCLLSLLPPALSSSCLFRRIPPFASHRARMPTISMFGILLVLRARPTILRHALSPVAVQIFSRHRRSPITRAGRTSRVWRRRAATARYLAGGRQAFACVYTGRTHTRWRWRARRDGSA